VPSVASSIRVASGERTTSTGQVAWSTRCAETEPSKQIVDESREWGADLIVTGSRGIGTLRRIMAGSVAHDVLTHARSSVLVMRGHVPARLHEPAVAARPAFG
jgi:nucleotide-binding universal stress UspA family protein